MTSSSSSSSTSTSSTSSSDAHSQPPPQCPHRMYFFDDATDRFRREVASDPSVCNAGKISRLLDALLLCAEQQHLSESLPAKERKRKTRHHLRTWHYSPRSKKNRQVSIPGFRKVATGEQNLFRDFLTFLSIGNSRKQLRPLHVEIAVLFATMATCGLPMATKHIWMFRTVFAKALGMSDNYVEVVIRSYDENLFQVINMFLTKLSETAQFPAPAEETGAYLRGLPNRKLEYVNQAWSKRTMEQARQVALTFRFPSRLSTAMSPLTILVAQFWDNVSSMTYPICKFENGKNRFIFRMSTGELCTGTTVRPKLGLEEVQAGGEAGQTGAQANVSAIFRRRKPDLQVVTSDDAIDCCINVALGNKRVMGMRERRALRVCLMLSCYTKYNLDTAWGTRGVFDVAGPSEHNRPGTVVDTAQQPEQGKPRATATLTCNSPPDLISLLLCDQIVTSVSRNGIAVVTGFAFRGIHTELVLDNETLFVRVRPRAEKPYVEIVQDLLANGSNYPRSPGSRARSTEGSESSQNDPNRPPTEAPRPHMPRTSVDPAQARRRPPPSRRRQHTGSASSQNDTNRSNQNNRTRDDNSATRNDGSGRGQNGMHDLEAILQPVLVLPQGLSVREESEWRSGVCGALRLFTVSQSVYLLTKDAWDNYKLHELTDTLSDHSDTSIYVL